MTPRTLFDECGIGDWIRVTHETDDVRDGVFYGLRRGTKSVWLTITHEVYADYSTELAKVVRVECVRRRGETELDPC